MNRTIRWIGGFVLASCLVPRPVGAALEASPATKEVGRLTRDPRVIASQIRLALHLEQRALTLLNATVEEDSVDRVSQMVYDGYVLIRYAIANNQGLIQLAKSSGDWRERQNKILEAARAHLRSCLTELGRAQVRTQNLEHAAEELQAAIRRIETAMIFAR